MRKNIKKKEKGKEQNQKCKGKKDVKKLRSRGLPKWKFLPETNLKSRLEKIGKSDFAPPPHEKFSRVMPLLAMHVSSCFRTGADAK